MSKIFDLAPLVELMATQKAALDKVQGLLDATYPGLKAGYTLSGIEITGPGGQMERLSRDFEAFQAKKQGQEPKKEH